MLSRQVAVQMASTGRSPWEGMSDLFSRADWIGGNLEGAIGPPNDCLVAAGELCFAIADSSTRLLSRAGFRVLTLSNNHSADLGSAGRERTREWLRTEGLLGVDFEHSPRFVRFGGVTMAVVAVDLVPGADGAVQRIPSTDVAQKLRLARSLAELVVVSIHWGKELQEWPSGEQRAAAEWLVGQGADLVVGHHPHVVQPPECIHGRPVFFSLGNHVFDQRDPVSKIGLIADCRLTRGRLNCDASRTRTRHGSSVPEPSDSAVAPQLDACAVPLREPLAVGGYEIRIEPWSPTGPQEGAVLEGWKEGTRRWRTRRVSLVTLQTGMSGKEGEPLLLALERHPSPMDHEVALRPHVYAVGDHGLIARWRGTALAWPLLDAVVDANGELCALHRGDSFVRPDPATKTTRAMEYRWNGFGFSTAGSATANEECTTQMKGLTGPG